MKKNLPFSVETIAVLSGKVARRYNFIKYLKGYDRIKSLLCTIQDKLHGLNTKPLNFRELEQLAWIAKDKDYQDYDTHTDSLLEQWGSDYLYSLTNPPKDRFEDVTLEVENG